VSAPHANHNSNHKSILGDLARHEKDLLGKLDAAQEEARKILERARGDASKHGSDEAARVQSEISAARTRAEQARMQAFDGSVAAAQDKLRGRRDAAMARVSEMAKQVTAFFLPKGGRA
jgi:tripartite-type tricarboxylate transporter receptor subunit TctC